uniref:Uncharacterized protein n=1 Tax=Anguilla anguilla TaxID=7936 RepID=A0A0E9QKJ8_ANGAN
MHPSLVLQQLNQVMFYSQSIKNKNEPFQSDF